VEVFISRGTHRVGLEAYEGMPPLLLVGAQHLEPDDPAYLDLQALQFVVASELAHLWFKHKRVTAADVRDGLFDKTGSFLGYASTVLQMVPAKQIAGVLGTQKTYLLVSRLVPSGVLKRVLGVGEGQSFARHVAPNLDRLLQAGAQQAEGMGAVIGRAKKPAARLLPHATASISGEQALGTQHRRLIDPCRVMAYTADRAGLLLCDDLGASVRAIFLSAPEYSAELSVVQRFGLARALARRDDGGRLLNEELVLRICALINFYLSDDYARVREALYGREAVGLLTGSSV